MSDAREALETFVKRYGSNAGYAVGFPVLLDALVAEVRDTAFTDVADVDAFLAQLHDTPYTRQTDWVTENYTLIRKAR